MEHEHLKPKGQGGRKDDQRRRGGRKSDRKQFGTDLPAPSRAGAGKAAGNPYAARPSLTVLMGQQSCIRRWQCVFRSSRKRLRPLLRHRLPKAVCPHPRHPASSFASVAVSEAVRGTSTVEEADGSAILGDAARTAADRPEYGDIPGLDGKIQRLEQKVPEGA